MNRVKMVILLSGWLWPLCNLTILGVKFLGAIYLCLIWSNAYQKHHFPLLKTLLQSTCHELDIKMDQIDQNGILSNDFYESMLPYMV